MARILQHTHRVIQSSNGTKLSKTKNSSLDKKVSVIICCYNDEQYIRRAIDSILNQSYKNIEIVIVNDGSTGDFQSVIQQYQSYSNIKFVNNKKNIGLFASRLVGYKHSTGDYIAFCDADDFVSFDYYRLLVQKLEENNYDFVIADFAFAYNDNTFEYLNLDPIFNLDLDLHDDEIYDFFMKQNGLCFSYYVVWNKLYTRKIFAHCYPYFEEFAHNNHKVTMCEDIAFSSLLWFFAKKIANVHNIFYYYFQHDHQVTLKELEPNEFIIHLKTIKNIFHFITKILVKFEVLNKFELNLKNWKALYSRIWYDKALKCGCQKQIAHVIKDTFNQDELFYTTAQDWFFGNTRTKFHDEFNWSDNIKKQIISDTTKYVSFDVFDTLITRPLLYPSDIFHLMTEQVNIILNSTTYIDFPNIRVEAEQNCRQVITLQTNREDITLDQIYTYIENLYHIEHEKIEHIKNLEITTEIELSSCRLLGKELYDLARYYNKKIIFISDMYLSKEIITTMLNKNGYETDDNVFVSSEIGLLKGTGNLFKEVLRQLNVTHGNEVLHIGDNWVADREKPREVGLKAEFIHNASERLLNNNPGLYTGNLLKKISVNAQFGFQMNFENFIGIRCMLGVIKNKLYDRFVLPYNKNSDVNISPYVVGYYVFGMHLYAVTDWLLQNNPNHRKIHFISRDGYIVKKAYKFLSGKDENNYFYFSRKAIVPFIINSLMDFDSFTSFMNYRVFSPHKLLKLFATIIKDQFKNDAILSDFCLQHNFSLYSYFKSHTHLFNFIKIMYSDIIDHNKLKQHHSAFKEYLSKIFVDNDIFFDLGYSGRNEELFSKLLNIHLDTYYIHTNQDIVDKRQYLSKFNKHLFYNTSPQMFVLLREHIFAEVGPSCIAYQEDHGQMQPVFESFTYTFQRDFITEMIQNSALNFINDFIRIFNKYKQILYYRRQEASIPFEYFLHYALDADKEIFACVPFEDDVYGGITLNITGHWKYLQKTYLNQNQFSYDLQIAQLNNKIQALEKQITLLMQKNTLLSTQNQSYLEEYKNIEKLQIELDKRWILLSHLLNELKQYDKQCLEKLKTINLEHILQSEMIPDPPDFDSHQYLQNYSDVRDSITNHAIPSAFCHYFLFGRKENRQR